MDTSLYSGFGKMRKIKGGLSTGQHLSLRDLVNSKYAVIEERQVIEAFCNDLKKLLGQDDVHQMIRELFTVENNISLLADMGEELPNLGDFHKNLSPILLRALVENTSDDFDRVLKSWKEALRIAIEEELYFWQDYLVRE